jgi:RNA polymerase sigma factor (sigma-70 family)
MADTVDEHATYAQLVLAARRGDDTAMSDLVRRLTPSLWRVARAHRLDTATCEDVIQATWLSLAEHLHDIRDPRAVVAWLMMTARRHCLAELRRVKRIDLTAEVDEGGETEWRTPDRDVLDADRDRRLRRAVGRLPDRDRLLLTLLVAQPPLSYTEISRVVGMPVGSIGPTRGRCLQRLRKELHAEGWDDASLMAH